MCCVNMFVFPTNLCALLLNILSIYNCNLCSCLANFTQQRIPEWPLSHIFLFVLILCLMKIILLNELGFMFHKGKRGLELFLCVLYKLCLFCMFSKRDILECQLFMKGCYFTTWEYMREWVCRSTYPMLLFILDFTKGKRLPYSGNIPNAQPPKGVIFIYFYLFLFIEYGILSSNKLLKECSFHLAW